PSNGLTHVLRSLAYNCELPPSVAEGWGGYLMGSPVRARVTFSVEIGDSAVLSKLREGLAAKAGGNPTAEAEPADDGAKKVVQASAYAVFHGRVVKMIAVILPKPPEFQFANGDEKPILEGVWLRVYTVDNYLDYEYTCEWDAVLFRAIAYELKE